MIRYHVTPAQLRRLIQAERTTWLDRAQRATDTLKELGRYQSMAPNWSDIKGVFLELQHRKCIFCERQLSGDEYGRIEHDIEHYRPKGAVRQWPTERIAQDRDLNYDFPLGGDDPAGYFLLTYVPRNYATACKTCNTIMKGSYFPISGPRGEPSPRVEDYRPEEPYLLLPIGDQGHNPESVLRFNGVIAVPRFRSGHRHRIARVMIDLFGFNDREELLYERARSITYLYLAHAHATNEGGPLVAEGRRAMEALTSDAAAHSNCARCYRRLLEEDEAGAREIFEAAWEYVEAV